MNQAVLVMLVVSITTVMGQLHFPLCYTVKVRGGRFLERAGIPEGCVFKSTNCEDRTSIQSLCSSTDLTCHDEGKVCRDPTITRVCQRLLWCENEKYGTTLYQPVYSEIADCECLPQNSECVSVEVPFGEGFKTNGIPLGCRYAGNDCDVDPELIQSLCSTADLVCHDEGNLCQDPDSTRVCQRALQCIDGTTLLQPVYSAETANCECLPINGEWGEWSNWSKCDVTCGEGHETRTRQCDNPPPSNGGLPCPGEPSDIRICVRPPCPMNGSWSEWSSWSSCDVTCGDGRQWRGRECNNPPPINGGADCQGDDAETQDCSGPECPINGEWGQWSAWSNCDVTCGIGFETRTRECDNPPPSNGGMACPGEDSDSRICIRPLCPINGGWGDWSPWSSCSVKCGDGQQGRGRECNNPPPSTGGAWCQGDDSETQACSEKPCRIYGGWGEWSTWSSCDVTCGDGRQWRGRECNNPPPSNGGRPCRKGYDSETQDCSGTPCPDGCISVAVPNGNGLNTTDIPEGCVYLGDNCQKILPFVQFLCSSVNLNCYYQGKSCCDSRRCLCRRYLECIWSPYEVVQPVYEKQPDCICQLRCD